MSFYNKVSNFFTRRFLAVKSNTSAAPGKRTLPWASKAVARTRQDIASWNNVLAMALSDEPKNWGLRLLYNEVRIDALLTSQIENRKQQVYSVPFKLKDTAGKEYEEQTAILKKLPAYRKLSNLVQESDYTGCELAELSYYKRAADGEMYLDVINIPGTNVVQQTGKFYPDYSEDKSINYREMPEYGTWILEFNSGGLGLINKAVPHVLFKRFAQSCWSELCEIYGIPPRVMKTNTQDPAMLNRAEQMMRDMSAAAWFIIDETESFEWATGIQTNGDVYKHLITQCSNELSLLISGAIIGQDTEHGNRSKEESSQEMLWQLVLADMAKLEEAWNNIILPALAAIGVLKPGLRFEFDEVEDLEALWKMTKEVLPFKNVDDQWIKDKFGIEVTGNRQAAAAGSTLSLDADFFV
jgi:hypothetical protein